MEQHNTSVGICDLPDEVLRLIFSALTVKDILTEVVDVCVRWREIIHDDAIFWKKLRVVIDCEMFFNISVLKPTSRLSLETVLKLEEQEDKIYIGEHDLKKVFKMQCITLQNGYKPILLPLDFDKDPYQARKVIKVIDVLSKYCNNLKKFEFSRCNGVADRNTLQFLNTKFEQIVEIKFDVSCIWIIPYEELTKYSNLNTIISHDYKFKRADFYCLTDGCSQLCSLWILFARYIKNEDVIYLLEKKKDSLRELGMGLTISDEVLSKVKDCSCLTVLFFSDARYISENGINSLTNLPNLKYISLHRAKLQPTSLITWTSSSTLISQLVVLDLTGYYFKDSKLLSLFPQNRCLVTFNNITEEAIHKPYKPNESKFHWMYSHLLKS